MAHQSIRIPPDSTGKKIFHKLEVLINYDNGTVDFSLGDTVVGFTSGLTGSIMHIDGNTAAGTIHVTLDIESPEQVIDGENLQVGGVTYATADGTIADGDKYFLPQVQIQGGNNTSQSASVDQYGQLYIRGAAGAFSFDSFGFLNAQGSSLLTEIQFQYGLDIDHYSQVVSGSGSVSRNPVLPACVLSCGTSSGDIARFIQDRYNHMDQAHPVEYATAIYFGDAGKENVVRRWGYYDDTQGAWFELDGTTLNIVVKIAHLGGYEYRIPQAAWNGDRCDGSGGAKNLSKYNIDITKTNIYSIQFQNAVGYIFFRLITDTGIVLCHVFPQINYFTGTSTGSRVMKLPMRWEQYNSGLASGISQMYVLGAVFFQYTDDYRVKRRGRSIEVDALPVTDTSYHALATIKMNKKYVGGDGSTVLDTENRSLVVPQDIQIWASGGPVSIASVINPTLNGSETFSVSASNLEFDVTGDYTSLGKVVQYNIVQDGEVWRYDHLPEGGGIRAESPMLTRRHKINSQPMLVGFAAKKLSSKDVNVSVTISWYEVG